MFTPYYTKDFLKKVKKLTINQKQEIEKAILVVLENPNKGKPLQHELKGTKSYRFGKKRLLYEVVNDKVWIIRVGNRDEVYK